MGSPEAAAGLHRAGGLSPARIRGLPLGASKVWLVSDFFCYAEATASWTGMARSTRQPDTRQPGRGSPATRRPGPRQPRTRGSRGHAANKHERLTGHGDRAAAHHSRSRACRPPSDCSAAAHHSRTRARRPPSHCSAAAHHGPSRARRPPSDRSAAEHRSRTRARRPPSDRNTAPESRTATSASRTPCRAAAKRLAPGAGQAMSQQPGEGVDGLVVTEGAANRLPALRDPDGTESFEQGIERGGQHGRIAR